MNQKNPTAAHGTMAGVWQHRAQRTIKCDLCLKIQAADRLLRRVLGGHQKGCYVPALLLADLLRSASSDTLALADELLPPGAVLAMEMLLTREMEAMEDENENPNPPTITCPFGCGADAQSQGGTSYYTCSNCDEDFDRDELDELDEHGQIRSE
jgi:hypothetical protein